MKYKRILLVLVILIFGTFLISCSSGSSNNNSNFDTVSDTDPDLDPGDDPNPDPDPDPEPDVVVPMGTNLGGVSDWNGAWEFVDLMKSSRQWITFNASGSSPWDTELRISVPADINGYPKEVPFAVQGEPDQKVRTVISHYGDYMPAGTYTVLFDGDGDLAFNGTGITSFERPSSNVYRLELIRGHQIWMDILRSDRSDHLRNIRFIMPGFQNTYEEQIFHPMYLEKLEGFSVLRFMDYMKTNGSGITSWSERTTPTSYTQRLDGGVSVEYMVELVNKLNVDAWFTIQHQVDDDYIRNFASKVIELIEPGRKVYVEYSNELWNYGFSQTAWKDEQGCGDPVTFVAHTTGDDWGITGCNDGLSGFRFQTKRSLEIFKIFQEEFGEDKDRIVKVLAGQAANSWTGRQLLEALEDLTIDPDGIGVDMYSIAPYFGGRVADQIVDNGEVVSISIETILSRAEQEMEERSFEWMQSNKELADEFDVELMAYEGGQHLVGTGDNKNNDSLTLILNEANRHPLMQGLYEKYYRKWFELGGGVFANFSYVSRPGKYGSWGIIEYQDQPIEDAPKYIGIRTIMEEFGYSFD